MAPLACEKVAVSNLTIAVDEALIRRARVRAIEEGTSVSAKVREFLQRYVAGAGDDPARQRHEAADRLQAMLDEVRKHQAAPAAGGVRRRTLRDELYDGDYRARDRGEVLAMREPDPEPAVRAARTGKPRRR
jgi:plasmid stability protein